MLRAGPGSLSSRHAPSSEDWKALLPPKAPGQGPSCLPSFWELLQSSEFLACGCVTPVSASILTQPSLFLSFLSCADGCGPGGVGGVEEGGPGMWSLWQPRAQ